VDKKCFPKVGDKFFENMKYLKNEGKSICAVQLSSKYV